MGSLNDLSFFNLIRYPERLSYLTKLKTALRKAAEVNGFAKAQGKNGFGRRLDMTLCLVAFTTSMRYDNEQVLDGPDSPNFIYIRFNVSPLTLTLPLF